MDPCQVVPPASGQTQLDTWYSQPLTDCLIVFFGRSDPPREQLTFSSSLVLGPILRLEL